MGWGYKTCMAWSGAGDADYLESIKLVVCTYLFYGADWRIFFLRRVCFTSALRMALQKDSGAVAAKRLFL